MLFADTTKRFQVGTSLSTEPTKSKQSKERQIMNVLVTLCGEAFVKSYLTFNCLIIEPKLSRLSLGSKVTQNSKAGIPCLTNVLS